MSGVADTIEQEPAASQSTALVVIPAAQLPMIMAAQGAADILARLRVMSALLDLADRCERATGPGAQQ